MGKGRRQSLLRAATLLLLAFGIAVTGLSFAAPSMAVAQEQARRPWTLRDLFFPRRADRVEPKKQAAPTVRKKPRQQQQARPAEPKVEVAEKLPDARTVLVVGDFLAAGLAEGLNEVFAANPRIRVLDRSNGSSGFVRDDYYNWPAKIGEIVETEKPAAVVVMLGANDRQQMRVDSGREAPLSEKWTEEYERRTAAMAKTVADAKVPLLWVGMPSFKQTKMLTDMLAFNDVYRTAAENVGAEFIDIWDGFVDENGAFVTTGPDINGQPVRLRAADGINVTRPGKRKMAFYVERPLFKILGETGATGVAALVPALPKEAVPVDVSKIDRTQPVSLRDPELDGGTELLGLVVEPKREAGSPGEKLAVEGLASAPVTGRADEFAMRPAAPAKPATTAEEPAAQTTTAIAP